MVNVDPALCPICGLVNHCAQVAQQDGETTNKPCWCFNEQFPPSLLKKVPSNAKEMACICERCTKGLELAKPI